MGKYIAIGLILIFIAELVYYVYLNYKNKKNDKLNDTVEIEDNEIFKEFMDCDKL